MRISQAIELATQHDVILCTYADLMRVPAGGSSLLKARSAGADIRMVYSTQDALNISSNNSDRQVVFFAIGFETTTPPTAVAIRQAVERGLKNFSVFCNHVLTPSAMRHLLGSPGTTTANRLDGFLGPSHVSTVIGSKPYEFVPEEYQKPVVIAGFEPLDVMQSTLMLIRQINEGRCLVENEYSRAVSREGNSKAQALMADIFQIRDSFQWRGLGEVPFSALRLSDSYENWDAEQRFTITSKQEKENKGCECPSILRGEKRPTDCKLFGTVCNPDNPMGSCMVSSEGACAAYWSYARFRD
jgi:hydrogenase expression/formation protein HypD